MCGINGIISLENTAIPLGKTLNIMTTLTEYRGPDGTGFMVFDQQTVHFSDRLPNDARALLAFSHNRLSIIDLSHHGFQPMQSDCGRYSIVYNGELYNYIELRRELTCLGYQFRTETDTEVLLKSMIHWGKSAFQKFIGMFAFVLFDRSEQTILLARDHFGIKPLYFYKTAEAFVFSSEIKAITEAFPESRQLSAQNTHGYLARGQTEFGTETLFKHIHQIRASSYSILDLNTHTFCSEVYWAPQIQTTFPKTSNFEEACEQLRGHLLESIKLHMRSDVPVGTALSGGIDSSSLVMGIRKVYPDSNINTFSYIPEEKDISEEAWIDICSLAGNTRSHKVTPTSCDLPNDIDHILWHLDHPSSSMSVYSQYRVFKLAKDSGIKVMLDGQGADEIFAGYNNYLVSAFLSKLGRHDFLSAKRFCQNVLSGKGKNAILAFFKSAGGQLANIYLKNNESLKPITQTRDFLNPDWFVQNRIIHPSRHSPDRANFLKDNLRLTLEKTSLPHLLRHEDRNSMAHSIESRVPFLNHTLVDFVYSLPDEYLISHQGTTKYILREAMRGLVPDQILNRKDKIGFNTPLNKWMLSNTKWVHEKIEIAQSSCVSSSLLNFNKICGYIENQQKTEIIWRTIAFGIWSERFKATL